MLAFTSTSVELLQRGLLILVEESLVYPSIASFGCLLDLQEGQSFVSGSDIGLWLQLFVVAWVVVDVVWACLLELGEVEIPRDNLSSPVGLLVLLQVSEVLDDEHLGDIVGVCKVDGQNKGGWHKCSV